MRRLNFGFESAHVALWSRVLFLLVGGLGFSSRELQAAKVNVPAASAPVVDEAQILNPSTRTELDEILRQVAASGTQLGVLTVNSLEGLTIEDYGIAVAEAWKLGQAKTDRGAVLIVAPRERRVRIEVGYGLEGELTDLQSGRIINDAMIPYFKRGDWDGGVRAGVGGILSLVAPDALAHSELQPPPRPRHRNSNGVVVLFVTFFLFMLLIRLLGGGGGGGFGGRRRRSGILDAIALGSLMGSSRRSSGFGGGGSSWGSWGGGGGGFGGGGASGSW